MHVQVAEAEAEEFVEAEDEEEDEAEEEEEVEYVDDADVDLDEVCRWLYALSAQYDDFSRARCAVYGHICNCNCCLVSTAA